MFSSSLTTTTTSSTSIDPSFYFQPNILRRRTSTTSTSQRILPNWLLEFANLTLMTSETPAPTPPPPSPIPSTNEAVSVIPRRISMTETQRDHVQSQLQQLIDVLATSLQHDLVESRHSLFPPPRERVSLDQQGRRLPAILARRVPSPPVEEDDANIFAGIDVDADYINPLVFEDSSDSSSATTRTTASLPATNSPTSAVTTSSLTSVASSSTTSASSTTRNIIDVDTWEPIPLTTTPTPPTTTTPTPPYNYPFHQLQNISTRSYQSESRTSLRGGRRSSPFNATTSASSTPTFIHHPYRRETRQTATFSALLQTTALTNAMTVEQIQRRICLRRLCAVNNPLVDTPIPTTSSPEWTELFSCKICCSNVIRVVGKCGHSLCLSCYKSMIERKSKREENCVLFGVTMENIRENEHSHGFRNYEMRIPTACFFCRSDFFKVPDSLVKSYRSSPELTDAVATGGYHGPPNQVEQKVSDMDCGVVFLFN